MNLSRIAVVLATVVASLLVVAPAQALECPAGTSDPLIVTPSANAVVLPCRIVGTGADARRVFTFVPSAGDDAYTYRGTLADVIEWRAYAPGPGEAALRPNDDPGVDTFVIEQQVVASGLGGASAFVAFGLPGGDRQPGAETIRLSGADDVLTGTTPHVGCVPWSGWGPLGDGHPVALDLGGGVDNVVCPGAVHVIGGAGDDTVNVSPGGAGLSQVDVAEGGVGFDTLVSTARLASTSRVRSFERVDAPRRSTIAPRARVRRNCRAVVLDNSRSTRRVRYEVAVRGRASRYVRVAPSSRVVRRVRAGARRVVVWGPADVRLASRRCT